MAQRRPRAQQSWASHELDDNVHQHHAWAGRQRNHHAAPASPHRYRNEAHAGDATPRRQRNHVLRCHQHRRSMQRVIGRFHCHMLALLHKGVRLLALLTNVARVAQPALLITSGTALSNQPPRRPRVSSANLHAIRPSRASLPRQLRTARDTTLVVSVTQWIHGVGRSAHVTSLLRDTWGCEKRNCHSAAPWVIRNAVQRATDSSTLHKHGRHGREQAASAWSSGARGSVAGTRPCTGSPIMTRASTPPITPPSPNNERRRAGRTR